VTDVVVAVTDESNPLLKVADQVSQQLRVPIAYEEPAWLAASDFIRQVDSPEIQARFSPAVIAKIDPAIRVAALGTVSAKAALHEGQDAMQVAADILQESLSDHSHRGNPGIFKLVSIGGYGYSIAPEQIRNGQGQWISFQSPLDARISFPTQDRPLEVTLQLIAKAVSEATREKVQADTQAVGLSSVYDVAKTHIGAQNEVARDVLARTFREMTVPNRPTPMMWWNLEYLIGHKPNNDAYRLSFKTVYYLTPDRHLVFVNWPKIMPQSNPSKVSE
jgi:hypothetical protein